MPRAGSKAALAQRRAQAWKLKSEGFSKQQIADHLGISRQIVIRDLAIVEMTLADAGDVLRGRKSLLTDEVHSVIVTNVQDGMPPCDAARAAGVALRTFNDWMQRGREAEERWDRTGEPPLDRREFRYVRLFNAVNQAQGIDIRTRVNRINHHAKDDWKADAFILQRVHRDSFVEKEPAVSATFTFGNLNISQEQLVSEANRIVAERLRQKGELPMPEADVVEEDEDE